jgi:hypothetical protein
MSRCATRNPGALGRGECALSRRDQGASNTDTDAPLHASKPTRTSPADDYRIYANGIEPWPGLGTMSSTPAARCCCSRTRITSRSGVLDIGFLVATSSRWLRCLSSRSAGMANISTLIGRRRALQKRVPSSPIWGSSILCGSCRPTRDGSEVMSRLTTGCSECAAARPATGPSVSETIQRKREARVDDQGPAAQPRRCCKRSSSCASRSGVPISSHAPVCSWPLTRAARAAARSNGASLKMPSLHPANNSAR